MSKILFIMTAADTWTLKDDTSHPTGFWAEEAVVPMETFLRSGYEVVVATPGGAVPPVDMGSLDVPDGDRFKTFIDNSAELNHPIALSDVRLDDYAAVFVPGGHGPMEDLAVDADAGALLTGALASGRPLGVVCHGPAALLAATDAEGRNAFAGYRVTAFSNEEERLGGLADKARWLLQDRLEEAGIRVVTGSPWKNHTVEDRNLLTGQNPASSAVLAEEVLESLSLG